jgi:hypothetical protein
MKNFRLKVLLLVSHISFLVAGVVIGIYSLPILMATSDPTSGTLVLGIKQTRYVATISENLTDSDFLHWGKGTFSLGDEYIVFQGNLAPGPAYQLYLAPKFIDTEKAFLEQKHLMQEVGDVTSFNDYVLPVNPEINIDQFNTVIIWCESFNQFITSAQYKL